jgi:pyrimidine operon attenuation protein/uracil phosphoribosyltransferase
MKTKTLFEKDAFIRTTYRLTHEIMEHHHDLSTLVIVGILKKGFELAQLIQQNLQLFASVNCPIYSLEIRPFRDDEKKDVSPFVTPIPVEGKTILLIDDVLFTGRSVRAAIDGLMTMGRPSSIELAVLIDRGHRQLPIRPDYVGKNVPTSLQESIRISFDALTIHLIKP